MESKIFFPTGDVYIGIKNKGEATTNERLYKALIAANISADPDPVRKEYNGEPIDVFLVTTDFVQMFYGKEKDFNLKFDVYIENNYIMQLFPLLKPSIQKKAKQKKWLKDRRGKSIFQETSN